MAGHGRRPKNVPVQEISDKRKKEVYQMRLQGWSQLTIAEKLGISQPAVSQILRRLNEEYYKNFFANIHEVKVDHASRLEKMREELILSWNKSPKGQEDIKILDEIRKVDADIRKIFGADAPNRTINTDVDVSKLSDDELRSIIEASSASGTNPSPEEKGA